MIEYRFAGDSSAARRESKSSPNLLLSGERDFSILGSGATGIVAQREYGALEIPAEGLLKRRCIHLVAVQAGGHSLITAVAETVSVGYRRDCCFGIGDAGFD